MGLLAVGVLVALIVTLRGANRERDHALQMQSHSYDVMILARSLAGTIARSEASLGRFVISGDKQLGQLYFDEWTLAGSQIDRLDRITDEQTDPLIDRLRDAYDVRGRELSLTAASTNYGRNSQALALYYQSRKAPALIRINTELDRIIARERQLLDRRAAVAAESVDRSSRVAGVLAVFGVLLVGGIIALGWFTLHTLTEGLLARAEAESERQRAAALTQAVEAATAELRVQEATLRQIQKMEAVGQLTGGIAHDFNNMLAVVLGGIELAKRADDLAVIRRHLDSAGEGADRAAALTRRLLAFSREEALKPEPIGPGALIAGMTDLLDRTLGDGITLTTCPGDRDWHVLADRVQLENVVLNLAVNARDAMAGRGTIAILTGTATLAEGAIGQCPAGDYVTLAVRDDGCGMTPQVAERVFEPFFTTKEAGKGTGLGLSQIFAFTRQHGGEIRIDTAPDQGTTVTLYLPRHHAAAAALALAPPSDAPAPGPSGLSVLVVEDDPRVLAATIATLEELGHHPIGCGDPLAAPALLEARDDIALLVSDVLMPRCTGPEMVAGLRDRFPDLPVLFVTGYAGEAQAAEFGEHRLLRKPFTLAALERAIADTLRDRPSRPGLAPDCIAAE